MLARENLATEVIRAHLVLAKKKRRLVDNRKDQGRHRRIWIWRCARSVKSDQEPATVDVQRAVITKRGNAPTIPVNSLVGDSQSNGRVENAINKVRNMVKTFLSSLESTWGIRVARDHPVCPWVFEWAASQAETLHNSARTSCTNR